MAAHSLQTLLYNFSFVIKEAPNGAPVPDKLYFMIGGFEPGVNIDSLGVFLGNRRRWRL